MKKYLKVVIGILIGLAVGIGLPLLERHLPPDRDNAFSGLASGATVFMEVGSIIVIAIVIGAYGWRYVERRRNLHARNSQ
ncbi:hypothetical protein [Burkholderia gladioli]|uniref:hypothetical protein n=1 Tax=Burkholderia gladioli TaxID=28095 RepID=UPI00163E78E7|nr:hypothetical protein [Burkholderia gladioli]